MSAHELSTEIEINTTPERVWAILTDFDAYPEWNPFIRFIRGVPQKGAHLEARLKRSDTLGMTIRPTVLAAEAGRELRWLGRLLLPGIFDGEHRFLIEPLAPRKVRFHQGERFRGILVPFFKRALDRDTKRGFNEMNRALKARAEAQEPVR